MSVNGIFGRVKDTAIGAVAVVGGKATTRLVRSRVLGMAAGSTLASVAELGIATAIGIIGEKFLGRQVARDMAVGGFAGVIEATAKQLGVPFMAEALGDEGGNHYIVNRGQVTRASLGNYAGGRASLGNYAGGTATRSPLNGQETQLFGG